MARQIFAEGTKNPEVEAVKNEAALTREESKPLEDGVIITSDEMEKLLHEWDVSGKNDLCVNATLAERIQQYLDYQKQMDPLKKEMAKRIYEPYKLNGDNGIATSIYVNTRYVGEMYLFKAYSTYRVIRINDFKYILMALGNQYAPWINEDGGMDLKGYIISLGGTYNYSYNNDKLEVTV